MVELTLIIRVLYVGTPQEELQGLDFLKGTNWKYVQDIATEKVYVKAVYEVQFL